MGTGFCSKGDSRSVLDAFFLKKALAEAVNERVESAVGEFWSALGRLQAEQQKQVQDFQEYVLERAKRAKEKAACEAMEAQSLIPKPSYYKFVLSYRGSHFSNLTTLIQLKCPRCRHDSLEGVSDGD